mmetsp:Transcript_15367/g.33779  ORF Transcript_15367/g.33779 Transcript_15367/m.33779 type:complete len:1321 (+) Transcript_15367:59-4021(+)
MEAAPPATASAASGDEGEKKVSSPVIDITPTKWERALAGSPCCCCWIWFAFAMVMTVAAMALLQNESLKFDQNGVWDVRGSEIQTQWDAFIQAREAFKVVNSDAYEERSQTFFPFYATYYSKEEGVENLLTADRLKWISESDSKVQALPEYQEYCQAVYGSDPTKPVHKFVSLDTAADRITATPAPEAGSALFFKGNSSILFDGGRYHVINVEGDSFQLASNDNSLAEKLEQFGDLDYIAPDGEFIQAIRRCVQTVTLSAVAFRNPEEQKKGMCEGFVTSTSRQSRGGSDAFTPVLSKVPGCDPDSLVYDDSNAPPCNFSYDLQCLSTAATGLSSAPSITQAQIDEELSFLCEEKQSEIDAVAALGYKTMRQNLLPQDWGCNGKSPGKSSIVRSLMFFGGPIKGYKTLTGDAATDQLDDLIEWAASDGLSAFEKLEKELNDASDDKTNVILMSQIFLSVAYTNLMVTESLYVLGSFWFVFMWVWCSTGSMFIAACCMFETFISLPLAMLAWKPFGDYLGFLCIMMIFVILGIGADDVFVLFDAWKQSGLLNFGEGEEALAKRFAWAYRRASGAMLVTTVTTVFCFFAAGLAEIPSISGFGYFAALVVTFDFLLVLTFFASAILIYHRYFEAKMKSSCACAGGSHMFCCPATCIRLDWNRPLFAQPRVAFPFFFLLIVGVVLCVFYPMGGAISICLAFIFLQATTSSQDDVSQPRPIEKFLQETFYAQLIKPVGKGLTVSSLLLLSWVVIVILAAIVVGTSLRLPEENEKFLTEGHRLQIFLDTDAEFQSQSNAMSHVYVAFGLDKAEALDRTGVDMGQPGTSWGKMVPDEPLGVLNFNEAARQSFLSQEGQSEIIGVCDTIRNTPAIANSDADCHLVNWGSVTFPRILADPDSDPGLMKVKPASGAAYYTADQSQPLTAVGNGFCATGVYCFMYDIRDYIVHFCDATRSPLTHKREMLESPRYCPEGPSGCKYEALCKDASGNDMNGGVGAFPSDNLESIMASEGYDLYITDVANAQRRQNGMSYDALPRSTRQGAFTQDGTFKFAFLSLNSSLPGASVNHDEQVFHHDRFEAFFEKHLTVNNQAFMAAFVFNWMTTVGTLLQNTIQSVAMALAFSWVVLVLATWNLIVGTLTLIVVAVIVLVSGGLIVAAGWNLGIIESICVIVVIGVSVDYSVHLAHAWEVHEVPDAENVPLHEQRRLKAQGALGTIGISLISGLVTSVGSTLFLWFSSINFFKKFGMFLSITLCVSFVAAFLLLIPLLMTFGPTGGCGDLPWRKKKDQPAKSSGAPSVSSGSPGSTAVATAEAPTTATTASPEVTEI